MINLYFYVVEIYLVEKNFDIFKYVTTLNLEIRSSLFGPGAHFIDIPILYKMYFVFLKSDENWWKY